VTWSAPTVVWFRNDLRLADNPALAAASSRGPVLGLFILDESDGARRLGGASRWWLEKSLQALQSDLAGRGVPLMLRRGSAGRCWRRSSPKPRRELSAGIDSMNPPSICRDGAIKRTLREVGIEVISCNGALLNEPGR